MDHPLCGAGRRQRVSVGSSINVLAPRQCGFAVNVIAKRLMLTALVFTEVINQNKMTVISLYISAIILLVSTRGVAPAGESTLHELTFQGPKPCLYFTYILFQSNFNNSIFSNKTCLT